MNFSLTSGTVIEGKYLVSEPLAAGGQGHVYKGVHLVLERPVALKVLRTGMTPEVMTRMTKRFEQEARLISSLRDPHTITLYDFGKLPDGSLFMVFEYIDGSSLKELIKSQGKLDARRVTKILRQTLASLQEAHAMGVLHRDIKPANIMVYEWAGRVDQVKLLDFGVAKILEAGAEDSSQKLTAANAVVGTPRYLAPELLLDEPPTPAADIYSLGLVAYEMLTGEHANKGKMAHQLFANQISPEPFTLPRSCELPDELRRVIDRMLQKDMSRRYTNADEILVELARLTNDSDPFAAELSLPTAPSAPQAAQPRAKVLKPSKKIKKRVQIIAPQMVSEPEPEPRAVEVAQLERELRELPSENAEYADLSEPSTPSARRGPSSPTVAQAPTKGAPRWLIPAVSVLLFVILSAAFALLLSSKFS